MKAITIWQPWASLLACGAKKYETRSWETSYRGPIALHAAKKPFNSGPYLDRVLHRYAGPLGLPDIYSFDTLPLGAIIATAVLVECHVIHKDPQTHRIVLFNSRGYQTSIAINSDESIFGDFTPGRYAWEFSSVTLLPVPVTVKGSQGLWAWDEKGGANNDKN